MFFGGRELAMTFNGEVYNFAEIRIGARECADSSSGARPTPRSFSPLTALWGTEAVHRFRGMFAFALADVKAARGLALP